MLSFLARLLGSICLAVAVIFAIGDIARSLSVDTLRLTPLSQGLAYAGIAVEPSVGPGGEPLAMLWTMAAGWPVSVVLAVIALVLLFIGRPRRREPARFPR